MPLSFIFNILLEVLARTIGKEKQNSPTSEKLKLKVSLFAENMIFYTENLKQSTTIH